MAEMLSKLKLGELFQKLKAGLEDLVKESKNMSETNRSVAMSEVGAIRNHKKQEAIRAIRQMQLQRHMRRQPCKGVFLWWRYAGL